MEADRLREMRNALLSSLMLLRRRKAELSAEGYLPLDVRAHVRRVELLHNDAWACVQRSSMRNGTGSEQDLDELADRVALACGKIAAL